MDRHKRNIRNNRREIRSERRRYDTLQPPPVKKQEANILEIWEEQKRIRAEEARLEMEYERTKQRAKELKIQIRQRHGFLSDIDGLDTTFYDEMVLGAHKTKLWSFKTLSRFKLRIEAWYLKARYAVGLPVKKRSSYRKEKFALAVVFVAVVGWIIYSPANTEQPTSNVLSESSTAPTQPEINRTPTISLLSRKGTQAAKMPGFTKSSPAGAAPAYVYQDSVKGIGLKVNQQELPKDLKQNPSSIEADNANRKFQASDVTVYAKDYADGTQAVLFHKEGLVVLIVAEKALADEDWTDYISSLVI